MSMPVINQAAKSIRTEITIPDNTALTTTFETLLDALSIPTREIIAIKVLSTLADGTARGAFNLADPRPTAADQSAVVATDFTDHAEYVAASEEWFDEGADAKYRFVRSTTGGTVAANIIVYLA